LPLRKTISLPFSYPYFVLKVYRVQKEMLTNKLMSTAPTKEMPMALITKMLNGIREMKAFFLMFFLIEK